jgi:hypothetical protein
MLTTSLSSLRLISDHQYQSIHGHLDAIVSFCLGTHPYRLQRLIRLARDRASAATLCLAVLGSVKPTRTFDQSSKSDKAVLRLLHKCRMVA